MEILAPYAAQEAAYRRDHHYRRCYSASPVGEYSKNFWMVAAMWMTAHGQSHSIALVIKMSLLRKFRDCSTRYYQSSVGTVWKLDEKKTELVVIYKANQKRNQWEMEANRWSMRWHDKTIQFNKGNTRWLGYHLDRCLNWHAHVDTCVQRALWKQQQVRRFMAGHGINRKLARTVSWSTSMATATYGLDVIYEGQQWIVDQIQKVAVRIAKDVAGLKATTAGCDAIRSADIPPTRAMLDRRTERHFMRMLTQNNQNSDLVPDEADGMVDGEDIPSLDSWTERAADDLWVLGDEVERSVPVDLEFAPWYEDNSDDLHTGSERGHHGWTDGSRRESAAFGWSLRGYNKQGKTVELVHNKGCLGQYETAFDGEMEAIADIMEFVNQNEIRGDLTIHSDAQAAIARVSHTGTGPGQDRAIRVVKAVQKRKERGWRTSIEWVLGHSGISGNERADQLAGEAAAEKKTGRTSIAWLKERVSQHYSMAKDIETERGKDSILPQAPKKSFLDGASNRLARTIAQIRNGHWLCAPYLKRTRKNRDDEVSDRCWWCGQWRMSRTHVFLRCMHPSLERARKEIWDRPDEEGRIPKRPTSIGQLLGKAKWEKPLADWILATGVGLLGPGKQDYEEERIERNDGWRREPFV
jgi:ribonuclease HI